VGVGGPFMILPECMGLAIDGTARKLLLERDRLPSSSSGWS
jgi:hypothetical protein